MLVLFALVVVIPSTFGQKEIDQTKIDQTKKEINQTEQLQIINNLFQTKKEIDQNKQLEKKYSIDINLKDGLLLKGNSSYYLNEASSNLTIGFSAGILGCLISSSSGYITNDTQTMKTISYIGAGIGLFGLVEVIVGSVQIGKASIALNREHNVYITPSKEGLGMNIRF